MNMTDFIRASFLEDVGPGDFTSLATIPEGTISRARLIVKEEGVLAGVELVKEILQLPEINLQARYLLEDGAVVKPGDIAFEVQGSAHSILKAERLILNMMQRMSGIATTTRKYVKAIEGTGTRLLDTRKTTPLLRVYEKWAVRIGGGYNHRFGLYDMILIKDNHIDYAGGVEKAITNTHTYLKNHQLDLPIEIEIRNMEELRQVLKMGGVTRIMLDNYSVSDLKAAVLLINKKFETEASGGITLQNIRPYAETGVDFISVGALTHSVKSLDLSLKAF